MRYFHATTIQYLIDEDPLLSEPKVIIAIGTDGCWYRFRSDVISLDPLAWPEAEKAGGIRLWRDFWTFLLDPIDPFYYAAPYYRGFLEAKYKTIKSSPVV